MERRRLACSEREARIMRVHFSRLRRSLQASRLRSIGLCFFADLFLAELR